MKYIKNKLEYAVTFKAEKDGRETPFTFDCFRVYQDTGNVATTGVTSIPEGDYDLLYKNCRPFKDFVDTGKLVLTSKAEANSVAGKIDDLSKENEALKKELAETKKELGTGSSDKVKKLEVENKAKDDEIADLKKQLESVKKNTKKTAKKDADAEAES